MKTDMHIESYLNTVDIPFDCEFLVAQLSSDKTVSLTEVYRVSRSHPLQAHRWGQWSSQGGLHGPSVPMYERRGDLQGIVLKAAVVHNPPMEYVIENGDGRLIFKGAFAHLWYEVERKVNFKANVLIQTPNSSSSKWSVILSPFSAKLWLAVIGCILFLACSLASIHGLQHWYVYRETAGQIDKYFQDSFICVWGSFCAQGHWAAPRLLATRQMYLFTFLTALTLLCAYSAKFVADLTIGKVVLPFTDMQGLLDDHSYNFIVQAQNGLYTNFQNATDATLRAVFKRKILPMKKYLPHTAPEGLAQLCKGQLAFMTSSHYYMFFSDKLPCPLSIIPHASFPLYHAYILPVNTPYLGIINHNLLKMTSTGILRKLYLAEWYRRFPEYELPLKSVGMEIAIPILSLAAIGTVASVVIVLMENKLHCQGGNSS